MYIIMPIGYGMTDMTNSKVVTDPAIQAAVIRNEIAHIRKQSPYEDIIDLSQVGQAAAAGTPPETENASQPLTYNVTTAKGTTAGTGRSSFEDMIATLLEGNGRGSLISLSSLGDVSFDSLMENINKISRGK